MLLQGRDLKVLSVRWFLLTEVEEDGVWPDGLLDAYAPVIPKVGGDATPLGQRPLCVLPVVHRTMRMFGCGLILLLTSVSLGPRIVEFHRVAP